MILSEKTTREIFPLTISLFPLSPLMGMCVTGVVGSVRRPPSASSGRAELTRPHTHHKQAMSVRAPRCRNAGPYGETHTLNSEHARIFTYAHSAGLPSTAGGATMPHQLLSCWLSV